MATYVALPDHTYELAPNNGDIPITLPNSHLRLSRARPRRAHGVLSTWVRTFWDETVTDLASIRWRRVGGRLLGHFMILLLMVLIALLTVQIPFIVEPSTMPDTNSRFYDNLCQPDGSFIYQGRPYNYFAASEAFSINIAFGKYAFSQVKLIDIAWDVLVGRGGQGICGLITYWVMTRAMTRLMESKSVTRADFEAVVFHEVSFTSLIIHLRGVFRRQPLRAALLTLWLLFSCAFVLIVPTLLAAMTGYNVRLRPYVVAPDGGLVRIQDFDPVFYVIRDGSRLGDGYHDNYAVTKPGGMASWFNNGVQGTARDFDNDCIFTDSTMTVTDNGKSPDMLLACAVSVYTSMSGFWGLNQSESVFPLNSLNSSRLPAPVLTIDAYLPFTRSPYINDDTAVSMLSRESPTTTAYGLTWVDPIPGGKAYPAYLINPPSKVLLGYNHVVYNSTTLNQNGTCSAGASQDIRYQWGFSALLLMLFMSALTVWTVGVYATYVDARMNSRLVVDGRKIGLTRATVDVYRAIAKKLDVAEGDIDLMNDAQLRKATQGVRLNYWTAREKCSVPETRSQRVGSWWRRFSIKTWVRREKYWLVLLAPCSIPIWLGAISISRENDDFGRPIAGYASLSAAWMPVVSVLLVLAMGPKVRSRWLVFALFSVVFIIAYAYILSSSR